MIKNLFEEKFHNHCFVGDISIDQSFNSNPNHIILEEEDQDNEKISFEEPIIKMCEDNNESRNELIPLLSCQMDDNNLESIEYNEKSNEEKLLLSESHQEYSSL